MSPPKSKKPVIGRPPTLPSEQERITVILHSEAVALADAEAEAQTLPGGPKVTRSDIIRMAVDEYFKTARHRASVLLVDRARELLDALAVADSAPKKR